VSRRDSFSEYATEKIGIIIQVLGTDTDANGDVLITITRESDDTAVVDADTATRDAAGTYSYVFSTDVSSTRGNYTATWSFDVTTPAASSPDSKQVVYQFAVGDAQPYFDSLDGPQRQLVDNVYHKISDSFDSTRGGPYLWELPQSSFSFETIARLMVVDAITIINYSSPKAFIPPYTVGANSPKPFPTGWYGLLERATQYETFKHLSTSYLEVPDPIGVNVARVDRQKYSQMWMQRADHEKEELDHMLHMLKRDMRFGVKARSMLLAGGIFPISYLNPARPRWPYVLSRFF